MSSPNSPSPGEVRSCAPSVHFLTGKCPSVLKHTPAIGPGRGLHGQEFVADADDSRRFARAILDTFMAGDPMGRPFSFPKPVIHISETFQTPGHEDFLLHSCRLAAEKGNPFFIFDRATDATDAAHSRVEDSFPWKKRMTAIHNVTLNLPRLGFKSSGDDAKLFSLLSELMELAAKAHVQKKKFIEELLSYGEKGPLSFLLLDQDGEPYLRMGRSTYLMRILGLDELVAVHKNLPSGLFGSGLEFGMKVIAHMNTVAEKLSEKYQMTFLLAQIPPETTAYRFARLDLKYFSPAAGRHQETL